MCQTKGDMEVKKQPLPSGDLAWLGGEMKNCHRTARSSPHSRRLPRTPEAQGEGCFPPRQGDLWKQSHTIYP